MQRQHRFYEEETTNQVVLYQSFLVNLSEGQRNDHALRTNCLSARVRIGEG
jgi:hypothetical protein